MSYKLNITELAYSDIDEIVSYMLEKLQNRTGAAHFLDELTALYDNLSENPFMYEQSRIPRLKRLGYRKAVIMNYVLLYLVDEDEHTVSIVRLFYDKRNYPKYL